MVRDDTTVPTYIARHPPTVLESPEDRLGNHSIEDVDVCILGCCFTVGEVWGVCIYWYSNAGVMQTVSRPSGVWV